MRPPSAILATAGFDRGAVSSRVGLQDLDRVPVRPAPWWIRLLWLGDVWAMTLPWAIYVDPARLDDPRLGGLLVHELVHVRQWRQLGVFRFLLRYLGDYLRGRLRGRSHDEAYQAIRFEIEARTIATAFL